MTSKLRIRLCQFIGHWIIRLEDHYDNESGQLTTRWKCRFCGQEQFSLSERVEGSFERQRWLIVAFLIFCMWVPLLLAEYFWWSENARPD